MNLHEECLLKYLLNPTDLFKTTEILKFHNSVIEEGFKRSSSRVKKKQNVLPA